MERSSSHLRHSFSDGVFFILGMFLASAVQAGGVDLTDTPLGTETKVPPNIWFSLDNSSSMKRGFSPDAIGPIYEFADIATCNNNPIPNSCWATVDTAKACPIYAENETSRCYTAAEWGSAADNEINSGFFRRGQPPMLSAAFNGLAYNPLITYTPPKGADGEYLPKMDESKWNAVRWPAAVTGTPPTRDLKGMTYTYSETQYKVLQQRYMVNADAAIWSLFKEGGSEGNKTYTLPPHYYKTSVKYCNKLRARGLGEDADPGVNFSNCQDELYQGYKYPYYYSPFGEYTGKTNNLIFPAFDLVVLDFANKKVNGKGAEETIEHIYYNAETGAMDSLPRKVKDELINYANWAAYYQTRIVAAKTVISQAFNEVNTNHAIPRVGFSSIESVTDGSTLNPDAFAGTQKTQFFNKLFNVALTSAGTPLREHLSRVGERFANASTSPIIHSCQRNYHIMFTDGSYANYSDTNSLTTNTGDLDGGKVGTLPSAFPDGVAVYGKVVTPDDYWPDIMRDYTGTSKALSDLALYYWKKDLSDKPNNVITTNKDPATWQHLNFIGMGFGIKGELPVLNQSVTLKELESGEKKWPKAVPREASAVDD